MSSKQQRETFDAIQWDGMKETATAFFGMNVLDPNVESMDYFCDEEGILYHNPESNVKYIITPGDWLVKSINGDIITLSDKQFNNEYDIIDEYPA